MDEQFETSGFDSSVKGAAPGNEVEGLNTQDHAQGPERQAQEQLISYYGTPTKMSQRRSN